MISVEQALKIHEKVIEKFGGAFGLRNGDALKSALTRPFQTFGGEDYIVLHLKKQRQLVKV